MKSILISLVTLVLALAFTGRAGAQSCYESSILSPSPFMGNNGEGFKLPDGSISELRPEVMILRNGRTYMLIVKGFDERLICRKLN